MLLLLLLLALLLALLLLALLELREKMSRAPLKVPVEAWLEEIVDDNASSSISTRPASPMRTK